MHSRKVQCTLTGYEGWLFSQLMERFGVTQAETLKRIVRDYGLALEEQLRAWGLSSEDFRLASQGNVLPMRAKKSQQNEEV